MSDNHTYIASLVSLSPFPISLIQVTTETRLGSLCDPATPRQLSVLHMIMCICWRHFLHLSQRQILCNLQSGSEKLGREKLGWVVAFFKQLWRNVSKTSWEEPERLLFRCFKKFICLRFALNPRSLPLGNRTQLPQKPVFSSCTRHKDAAAHLFSQHNIQGKRWQRGVFLLYPRNSHSLVLKKWTSLYNATFVKHYNVSRLSVPTLWVTNWPRFA